MADNVDITAGSGTTIATDDCTTGHAQLVKIAYSADGNRTHVTADADGMLVNLGANNDVAATQSGTWNITNVSGTVSLPTGAATEATLNSTKTAVELIDDAIFADDAAFTLGTSKGVMVMGFAGTQSVDANDAAALACDTDGALHIADGGNSITVDNGGTFATQAAQSGTWTVQPGNTANTTPWLVSQTPATSGGLTTYHLVSAASTNATVVKNSAGQLYGYYIFNSNASTRKLAFHNTASTPTAGASIFFTLPIPAGSAANVAFPSGIAFSSGISITTVTGLADSDATAVGANDLIINLFYK